MCFKKYRYPFGDLGKYFSLVFYLQNNQKYKGTDEEDLLEDQEVDNQHYDANGHSLQQPPHDETDQENLSQHTVCFQSIEIAKRNSSIWQFF